MNKFDWFKNKFQLSLSDDEQVDIFNRYCDINVDEHIYHMSDINEFFKNCTPLEILSSVADCEFNVANEYFAIVKGSIESFSGPYLIIKDYLGDIFNRMHIWETNINLDDYIQDMYDAHFDLKPEDMDSDKFYDIVEDAVDSYDIENDIVDWIKKSVSEE